MLDDQSGNLELLLQLGMPQIKRADTSVLKVVFLLAKLGSILLFEFSCVDDIFYIDFLQVKILSMNNLSVQNLPGHACGREF